MSNLKAKFKNGMLRIKIQRHVSEKQPVRRTIPIETKTSTHSGEGSVGVEKRVEHTPQKQSKKQVEITSGQQGAK